MSQKKKKLTLKQKHALSQQTSKKKDQPSNFSKPERILFGVLVAIVLLAYFNSKNTIYWDYRNDTYRLTVLLGLPSLFLVIVGIIKFTDVWNMAKYPFQSLRMLALIVFLTFFSVSAGLKMVNAMHTKPKGWVKGEVVDKYISRKKSTRSYIVKVQYKTIRPYRVKVSQNDFQSIGLGDSLVMTLHEGTLGWKYAKDYTIFHKHRDW